MKAKLLLAGMMLSSATAMASSDIQVPEICKSVATYAAMSLQLEFTDGTWADKYNPKSIRLHRDPDKYPITKETYLGNCDEDQNLKESWCRVAGGSPDIYQVEVSQKDGNTSYPVADVVVNFNRGGCHVVQTEIK